MHKNFRRSPPSESLGAGSLFTLYSLFLMRFAHCFNPVVARRFSVDVQPLPYGPLFNGACTELEQGEYRVRIVQNFRETAYTETQQRGQSVYSMIAGCLRSDNRETTCFEHINWRGQRLT